MYLHISSADELEDSYRDKNQGQRHTRTNNDEEEESNGPGTNVHLVLVSLLGRKSERAHMKKIRYFNRSKTATCDSLTAIRSRNIRERKWRRDHACGRSHHIAWTLTF